MIKRFLLCWKPEVLGRLCGDKNKTIKIIIIK